MQQQLLIPLDGSALNEAILSQASALARATGSALHLLHVAPSSVVIGPFYGASFVVPESQHEAILNEARDYLLCITRSLEAEGLVVHTSIMEGDVADAILASTQQFPIKLVVMPAHMHSTLYRFVFDSTTERVAYSLPCPLLLLHPQHEVQHTFRTIFVPLNGSLTDEPVLLGAQRLAARIGALLVLLYMPHDAILSEDTAEQRNYLEERARPLREQGLAVQTEVMAGRPEVEMSRVCDEHHPDLIVLPLARSSERRNGIFKRIVQKGIPLLLVSVPHHSSATTRSRQTGQLV